MPLLSRDDGVRIFYEVHNPEGAATPIVLTHGFAATTAMWSQNVDELSKDRPVLVWDQRGHGASDAPDEPHKYSEQVCVDDLVGLLEVAGFSRVVMGGMSLGGYLSLAFHYQHPDRVAGLILVDTGPGYKSDSSRAAWNDQVEKSAGLLESGQPEAVFHSAEMRLDHHAHPEVLPMAARGVMKQHDDRIIRSLSTIEKPTLVVVGEDDDAYRGGADYLATRISGATQVVLPDAGHVSNKDQPELFNAAVRTFLEEL